MTRVLLGASSLLSNGAMLGPAGTAMVAALARALQVPVIVAAESYKCSEKVQLDSIVYNELGHPCEIALMAAPGGAAGGGGASSEDGAATGSNSAAAAVASLYIPVPQRQSGYRGAADARAATSSTVDVGSADNNNTISDPVTVPARWRSSTTNNNNNASESSSSATPPPPPFSVVNLRYDLTPIGNISVVATETGLTPPTSIPVLMRELQQSDQQLQVQQLQLQQQQQRQQPVQPPIQQQKHGGGTSSVMES